MNEFNLAREPVGYCSLHYATLNTFCRFQPLSFFFFFFLLSARSYRLCVNALSSPGRFVFHGKANEPKEGGGGVSGGCSARKRRNYDTAYKIRFRKVDSLRHSAN